MTAAELWALNCRAYQVAIEAAEVRGDAMLAVRLRTALRAIEQRKPDDARSERV